MAVVIDPLFLVFVALSVGVVAAGWIVVGKAFEHRSGTIVEVQVEAPTAPEREFESMKASAPAPGVPAPLTRMVRVDVAEMHAEIEQFLREQSR